MPSSSLGVTSNLATFGKFPGRAVKSHSRKLRVGFFSTTSPKPPASQQEALAEEDVVRWLLDCDEDDLVSVVRRVCQQRGRLVRRAMRRVSRLNAETRGIRVCSPLPCALLVVAASALFHLPRAVFVVSLSFSLLRRASSFFLPSCGRGIDSDPILENLVRCMPADTVFLDRRLSGSRVCVHPSARSGRVTSVGRGVCSEGRAGGCPTDQQGPSDASPCASERASGTVVETRIVPAAPHAPNRGRFRADAVDFGQIWAKPAGSPKARSRCWRSGA